MLSDHRLPYLQRWKQHWGKYYCINQVDVATKALTFMTPKV